MENYLLTANPLLYPFRKEEIGKTNRTGFREYGEDVSCKYHPIRSTSNVKATKRAIDLAKKHNAIT
jgi:hypothetical protein